MLKKQKRILYLLMLLVLTTSLVACGAPPTAELEPTVEQPVSEVQPTAEVPPTSEVVEVAETEAPAVTEAEAGFPTGEITFIAPIDTPGFFPDMGQTFMNMHPGVTVNVIEAAWDNIHEKLTTDFAAGGYTYDAVMVPADYIPEFASAEWLLPFTEDQVAAITEDNIAMNIAQFEGDVWGAPFTAYPQLLSYNTQMLEAAGAEAPTTFSEWHEVCLKVVEAGNQYCMLLPLKQGRYAPMKFENFTYAMGGKIADEEGNMVLAEDPRTLAACEWIRAGMLDHKYIDPASIETDDFQDITSYGDGRWAFDNNSAWAFFQGASNPEMSNIIGYSHVLLWPTGDDGVGGGTRSFGAVLSIPTNAKNAELAWEFIKFMVSDEGQKKQLFDTGNLPVYAHLFTDPEVVEKIVDIELMGEQIKLGTSTLPYRWEPEYERILGPWLHKAWLGELTCQEALSGAQTEIEEMIASYE